MSYLYLISSFKQTKKQKTKQWWLLNLHQIPSLEASPSLLRPRTRCPSRQDWQIQRHCQLPKPRSLPLFTIARRAILPGDFEILPSTLDGTRESNPCERCDGRGRDPRGVPKRLSRCSVSLLPQQRWREELLTQRPGRVRWC